MEDPEQHQHEVPDDASEHTFWLVRLLVRLTRLKYLVSMLLGVGLLLPYNGFIVAVEYYAKLLGNANVEFYTVSCQLGLTMLSTFVLFAMQLHQQRVLAWLVHGSFLLLVAVMSALTAALRLVPHSGVLPVLLSASCMVGLLQSTGMYGMLGYYGKRGHQYIQGVSAGNGIAGLLAVGMQAVAKALFFGSVSGTEKANLVFMCVSIGVLVLCSLSFGYVDLIMGDPPEDAAQGLQAQAAGLSSNAGPDYDGLPEDAHAGLAAHPAQSPFGYSDPASDGPYAPKPISMVGGMRTGKGPESESDAMLPVQDSGRAGLARARTSTERAGLATLARRCQSTLRFWWAVFSNGPGAYLSCVLVLFVTLLLFPGVTSRICPAHAFWKSWFQLVTPGMFMIGDYVGRTLPALAMPRVLTGRVVLILALARGGLAPLLILAVYRKPIASDTYTIALVGLLALTNGYLVTIAAMLTSIQASDMHKSAAGALLTMLMNVGLGTGGLAGLLVGVVALPPPQSGICAIS